jgi:hypothetical protein
MRQRIRSNLTYANVMATLAVFLVLGATALASYVVSSNSQVGPGTISGHKPPSGKHANIIAGSLSGRDLSDQLMGSLRLHCPSGLARAGDICYETQQSGGTLAQAIKACASKRLRVPSPSELALVFGHLAPDQTPEWVDTQYYDMNGFSTGTLVYDDSSRNIHFAEDNAEGPDTEAYRCVTSTLN